MSLSRQNPVPQAFNLKLNNHQSFLIGSLADFYQNEAFADVTLSAEGRLIQAHRVILASCSPYFRDVLFGFENTDKHPIILLKDVPFVDLKAIVDFIYKGETTIPSHQLDSLLRNGVSLKIKGLMDVNNKTNDRIEQDQNQSKGSNDNENDKSSEEKTAKRSRKRTWKKQTHSKSNIVQNNLDLMIPGSSSGDNTNKELSSDEQTSAKIIKINQNDNVNSHAVSGDEDALSNSFDSKSVSPNATHILSTLRTTSTSLIGENMISNGQNDESNFDHVNSVEQFVILNSSQDVNIKQSQTESHHLIQVHQTSQQSGDKLIKEQEQEEEEHFESSTDEIPQALIVPNLEAEIDLVNSIAYPLGNLMLSSIQTEIQVPKLKIYRGAKCIRGTLNRSQKKHKCPLCSKEYVSTQNLRGHIKNTHTNPNEKYICQECSKEYSWKHALDRHVKTKHNSLVI